MRSFVDVLPVEPVIATTRTIVEPRPRHARDRHQRARGSSTRTTRARPRSRRRRDLGYPARRSRPQHRPRTRRRRSRARRGCRAARRSTHPVPSVARVVRERAEQRSSGSPATISTRGRGGDFGGGQTHRSASNSSRATVRSSNGTVTPARDLALSRDPCPRSARRRPAARSRARRGSRHGDRAARPGRRSGTPASTSAAIAAGVLRTRVVGGEHREVGRLRRRAHLRPLLAVAVAAAAEHDDHPASGAAIERAPRRAPARALRACARSRRAPRVRARCRSAPSDRERRAGSRDRRRWRRATHRPASAVAAAASAFSTLKRPGNARSTRRAGRCVCRPDRSAYRRGVELDGRRARTSASWVRRRRSRTS